MTVKTYLEKLESSAAAYPEAAKKEILESAEIWSNNACAGYTASAAIAAGLDQKQTAAVMDALQAAFENMTTDEAKAFYESHDY